MAGSGASRRPSRGSSAAVAAECAAARHRGGRARRGRSGGRARCCERARRVTRAIITPLSPAWRGHRLLLGRGGPGARAPGAYDPPGQARWPGARGGVRVPRERGARVARRARPASRGWLRPRRTAWWARTPRPSVCCLEGRERRARRVRPLSLSLSLSVCRSKGVVERCALTGAGGPLASAPTVLSDYGVRAAARCVRTAQPPPFSCPQAESP